MTDYSDLIKTLAELSTEQSNPKSIDIDKKPALEIVNIINDEDKLVANVVATQLETIAAVAEAFAETIKNGGRVFYMGAGTSGRLGVLDAAECPPTFGSDPNQISGIISGGYDTLVLSQEGVEDDTAAAAIDIDQRQINKNDMVIGIAASRRTPYTLAGLKRAHELKAITALIVCNQWNENDNRDYIEHLIELEVGPEIITGSTRMKSGTAQKMTLNLISTTAMVRLGKTFGNLMVDLQAKSEKLAARSLKILIDLFGLNDEEAGQLLARANGSVKLAIVMQMNQCTANEAVKLLDNADGFISKIKGRA